MLIHDKDFLLNQKSLLLFIANLQEPIIIMMGSCNLLFLPLTFDQKHTIFTPNSLSSSFSSETKSCLFVCLFVCELLFLIWPQLFKRKVMLSSGRNNWHSFPNTYSFESDLSDGARYSHHH